MSSIFPVFFTKDCEQNLGENAIIVSNYSTIYYKNSAWPQTKNPQIK